MTAGSVLARPAQAGAGTPLKGVRVLELVSRRLGYASVAEAMGGMRYLNGFSGELPTEVCCRWASSLAGLFAFHGILMTLYWRDARGGGGGQVIDVSLVESCFAMLESVVPEYAATGGVRGPSGTRLDGLAPSNVFRATDGGVIIAANQDTVSSGCALRWRDRNSLAIRGSPPIPRVASTRTSSTESSRNG